MAENNLSTLNNALFAQLERLESAEGESLESEINRTKAVSSLAQNIVANSKLALDAYRIMDAEGSFGDTHSAVVHMLVGRRENP